MNVSLGGVGEVMKVQAFLLLLYLACAVLQLRKQRFTWSR